MNTNTSYAPLRARCRVTTTARFARSFRTRKLTTIQPETLIPKRMTNFRAARLLCSPELQAVRLQPRAAGLALDVLSPRYEATAKRWDASIDVDVLLDEQDDALRLVERSPRCRRRPRPLDRQPVPILPRPLRRSPSVEAHPLPRA